MVEYGTPSTQRHTPLSPNAAPALYRVGEGSQWAGVCVGLETAGRGSASNWRLLFVIGSIFIWFPLIAYVVMAVALPKYATKREALAASKQGSSGSPISANAYSISASLEEELSRLKKMLDQGLITKDEHQKLRAKALGL
jgi:phage shock protein PspC (stress-responsive transcriptional regulator)